MARHLPAIVPGQRSLSRVDDSPSSVGRVLAAVAPDVIRTAGRIAAQRMQQREQSQPGIASREQTGAIQLSEVEIDISMPLVRRVTMRNLTAWQYSPATESQVVDTRKSGAKLSRRLGVIGASSVLALCLGVLARRVGPFSNHNGNIIDVTGKPKP